jgi:hypothetical protein
MENQSAKKDLVLTPLPEIKLPAQRAPVMEFTWPETKEKEEEKTEKKTAVAAVKSIYHGGGEMSLLENARDALVGIPADLLAGRGSLQEIFTKGNRLRGLGIIFVLVAVFVAVSRLV